MDGYACHLSFKTLSLLKNGIIVAGLPANTSHVLQPLDVSVFGQLKEEVRRRLSLQKAYKVKRDRNEVFTVCELLPDSYYACVNPRNTIAGFKNRGIWSDEKEGVEMSVIQPTDYQATFRPSANKICHQHDHRLFCSSVNICSQKDGPNVRIVQRQTTL